MNENYLLTGLAVAVAVFIFFWAISPVVNRLDRISFVIASMTTQPHGMLALKAYWYLFKNEHILKEMETKRDNGEEIRFNLPI